MRMFTVATVIAFSLGGAAAAQSAGRLPLEDDCRFGVTSYVRPAERGPALEPAHVAGDVPATVRDARALVADGAAGPRQPRR